MKTLHHLSFIRRVFIWAGLIGLGCVTTATAQKGTFDSGSDGSDGALLVIGSLALTENYSVAYDSTRNEVVVFGGDSYSGNAGKIDHTYTFDGISWHREQPELSPPAREDAAMAYDSVRQQLVLYSGAFSQNDCWLWDSSTWMEVDPPDLDRAFYKFSLAFDTARSETIMVVKPEFGSSEMETWGFNGTTWTQKLPATSVPGQNDIALTYDETLQKVIMLLRVNSSEFQTWTWDGTDWTQVLTDPVEIDINNGALAYDGRTNTTIFLGSDAAFTFTGSNWISLENVPPEFAFGVDSLVHHPGLNALLRLNGSFLTESGGVQQRNETWAWYADGSTDLLTSGTYTFDMSEKPDGIWNYTTIDIGPNVLVDFTNNDANTAVRWLASGAVNIGGTLNLQGKLHEEPNLLPYPRGLGGIPGPGGYPGSTAGPIGSALHVPGGGPGGGLYTGVAGSQKGNLFDYSNPWIYPLTGGSGAGNVGVSTGGGAGGGALLIASDDTITVSGSILVNSINQSNNTQEDGSAGAVLLRANTIQGDGSISAARIRLEAWERELDDLALTPIGNNPFKAVTEGPPLLPVELGGNAPRIWVDTINGSSVADPLLSPDSQVEADAYLSGSGTVAIVVKGENIPELAEIFLKISLQDGSVLEPDAAMYTGGQATINVDLPKGFGAIAVTAKFPRDI